MKMLPLVIKIIKKNLKYLVIYLKKLNNNFKKNEYKKNIYKSNLK